MTTSKGSVVFFGNERIATGVQTTAPAVRALIDAGYTIKAIVSHHSDATSRSARQLEIQEVAQKHSIPVLLPDKPADIADHLRELKAEVGVLVAYGKIVPQSVIDIFPRGIVNIHPSLLPKHRGPTPIESALLSGEATTGVTVMSLVKAMDAGPIYQQQQVALRGYETKQELSDKLLGLGSEMVIDVLPRILDGTAQPTPQDDLEATYDQLLRKSDGNIDWMKPAEELEREVRAFANWPKSKTTIAGKDVVICDVEIMDQSGEPGEVHINGKDLIVFCGKRSLKITRLKPAGKKEMTGESFIAGHKHAL